MVHWISRRVLALSEWITRRTRDEGGINQNDCGRHNQADRHHQSGAGADDECIRNRINGTSMHPAADGGSNTLQNATAKNAIDCINPQTAHVDHVITLDRQHDLVPTDEQTATSHDGKNHEFPASERIRIWKNVLVLGLAFMIHFTAFWGASNLQSSINADEALGTFTLAAIYGSLILSNILLPAITIKWLGCKWTIALSFVTYMPFIISQFYPRFYTMIPAGLAVGFGGGPMWCAKATYLAMVADAYAHTADFSVGGGNDVILTRFFGVFFMFFQLSQVWGNLISSAVLSQRDEGAASLVNNATDVTSSALFDEILHKSNLNDSLNETNFCGANFQPDRVVETDNVNLEPPSAYKINLITTIYLACMVAAFLIVALFLDSQTRYKKSKRADNTSSLSGLRLLAVTLRQLSNPYQLLILPITMFIGAEQAFLAADYTAAFVACGIGIGNIGYVMICFGVCNAISCFATGAITKLTGRIPVMVFAVCAHIALIITLRVWLPTSRNTHTYFIVAGLWGFADAMWMVQINTLYGVLNPTQKEAAFCNFRLWESTGSVLTYASSPFVHTRVRLYLLLGLLLIGFTGYATIEVQERRGRKGHHENPIIEKKNSIKLISAGQDK